MSLFNNDLYGFGAFNGAPIEHSIEDEYDPQRDPDYCGYCKCSPCQCDGHGHTKNSTGTCGYCGDDIVDGKCSCDGFGGDPITHYKSCRYCGGDCYGHICDDCGRAQ